MAQSVAPGNIQAGAKIVFNVPYDDKYVYHIKVTNPEDVGYAFKTTNMKRLRVDLPCIVLSPKECVFVAMTCDAFQCGAESTNRSLCHRMDNYFSASIDRLKVDEKIIYPPARISIVNIPSYPFRRDRFRGELDYRSYVGALHN